MKNLIVERLILDDSEVMAQQVTPAGSVPSTSRHLYLVDGQEGLKVGEQHQEKVVEQSPIGALPRYEGGVREVVETYLKKIGVLVGEREYEGGSCMVVDFDHLRAVHKGMFARFTANRLGGVEEAKGVYQDKLMMLLRFFGDEKVFDLRDGADDEVSPKAFFYIPNTIGDAMNAESIRNADFHLGIWDIGRNGRSRVAKHAEEHPITYLQPTVSMGSEKDVLCEVEVEWAIKLFNHKYGNAYRDDKGNLMVRTSSGEYKKVSFHVLEELGLQPSRLNLEDGKHVRTLTQSIGLRLPHLDRAGLLTRTDFREMGHMHRGESVTVERAVSSSGYVMLNRVMHYLGKKYHRANRTKGEGDVRVMYTHGDAKGYLYEYVDGGRRRIAHFTVLSQENARQTEKGYYVVGPDKVRLVEETAPERMLPTMPDQDENTRQEQVLNEERAYSILPDMMRDLEIKGVSLSNVPPEDRVRIARVATMFRGTEKYQHFLTFVEKYRTAPLDCFDAFLYGCEYGDRLLLLSERLPRPEMISVLQSFRTIAEAGEKFSKHIVPDTFEGADILRVQLEEALLRRTKDVVNVLSRTVRGEPAHAEVFGGRKEVKVTKTFEATRALTVISRVIEHVASLFDEDTLNRPRYLETTTHEVNFAELGVVHEGPVMRFHHYEVFDQKTGRPVHLVVQVRERGVLRDHADIRHEFDGEARINMLLDYDYEGDDIHAIERVDSVERARAFSLRMDRESMDIDQHDRIINNDPGREQGRMSLDIGSLFFPTQGVGGRESECDLVGRVIAVGNAISSKEDMFEQGKPAELYHNRRSFSESFGNAANFQKMVTSFEKQLALHRVQ